MLKIAKKEDIQSESTENDFRVEKDTESKLRQLLDSEKDLVFAEVEKMYQFVPSMNAQILAHIIRSVSIKMSQSNYLQSIDFLLSLYEIPHDQNQLRYYLKNKFKIDPILFLLTLLQRKSVPLAIKLAATVIDCYTLTLMLDGKDLIKLWKKQMTKTRLEYQSLEKIQSILKKLDEKVEPTGKNNLKSNEQGFRRLVIPL